MQGAGNGHGACILIVEDDENALISMRNYLTRANFKIRTATNGWEALKQLKDGLIDLVITELTMQDMDGCNLREKCVLQPETREIPFLVLVPEERVDKQVFALRSGVDDCIVKPFDPIVLVARVQAVLERRMAYERMVRIDPLTRLLNRPSLMEEVANEVSRVVRYKRHASLVLIDVDNFGEVNREGGVAMGDLMLTCLAGVILTTMRTMDIAGRFRGGKFLIYLPETDTGGAEIFAQRVHKQLSVIADTLAGFRLTFSGGIASAPQHGLSVEELIEHADQALRQAKTGEKGGVTVWNESMADQVAAVPQA